MIIVVFPNPGNALRGFCIVVLELSGVSGGLWITP